jgi:hypothetical protein
MALFEFVLASVNLQRFQKKKKRRIRGYFFLHWWDMLENVPSFEFRAQV